MPKWKMVAKVSPTDEDMWHAVLSFFRFFSVFSQHGGHEIVYLHMKRLVYECLWGVRKKHIIRETTYTDLTYLKHCLGHHSPCIIETTTTDRCHCLTALFFGLLNVFIDGLRMKRRTKSESGYTTVVNTWPKLIKITSSCVESNRWTKLLYKIELPWVVGDSIHSTTSTFIS